jgi:hypothetical protein
MSRACAVPHNNRLRHFGQLASIFSLFQKGHPQNYEIGARPACACPAPWLLADYIVPPSLLGLPTCGACFCSVSLLRALASDIDAALGSLTMPPSLTPFP